MVFKPGQSGNPKGRMPNSKMPETLEFKQALNNLLEFAAPEMIGWLKTVAKTNPDKALNHMASLAEYIHPKLARSETRVALGLTLEQLVGHSFPPALPSNAPVTIENPPQPQDDSA